MILFLLGVAYGVFMGMATAYYLVGRP